MATGRTNAGAGFAIDAATAQTLPGTAVNGRLVILTGLAAPSITLGGNAPQSPAGGDIWVRATRGGAYPLSWGAGLRKLILTPGAALQWTGSQWVGREAYVGQAGAWRMCSTISPLASLSWRQVGELSNSGESMSAFFAIGDRTTAALGTGESLQLEIVGFGQDFLADGTGRAAITFGAVDCLNDRRAFGAAATDMFWHSANTLRPWLQGEFFNALPQDLRGAIRPVIKKTSNTAGNASAFTQTVDTVFLPAIMELGEVTGALAGEGTPYARFTDAASRIKRVGGTATAWWTRTTSLVSTTPYIRLIAAVGGASLSGNATYTNAVAPFFCIGRTAG